MGNNVPGEQALPSVAANGRGRRFSGQLPGTSSSPDRQRGQREYASAVFSGLYLLGATAAEPGTKVALLNNLNRVALNVARGRTWTDLNQLAFVALARKVAEEAVGRRAARYPEEY